MALARLEKRPSLVDEVMRRLREDIEIQGLRAGNRLPTEQDLTARLGVSRTVLREAFSRLEATGLVSIQRGRGTFVADNAAVVNCARLMRSTVTINQRDLREMIELRTALESQVARRAAERMTDKGVSELRAYLEIMCDDCTPRDEVMKVDYRFHEQITDIADSELLRTHLATVREFIMAAILRLPPPEEGVGAINRRMHEPIVEALDRRDLEAADRAMRLHMQVLGARLCAPQ